MPTPGLRFVSSRIIDPKKLPDDQYNRFYNEEHLPHVLSAGRSKLALRYKSVSPSSPLPYLALYPIEDYETMGTPEARKFEKEARKSRTLGVDDIFDLIHFEMKPYEKIQSYEAYGHEKQTGRDRGRTLVCVAMEPQEGDDEELESWYRKQHLDMLGMCKGFRRCTRYKRLDDVCPRFLALHEYDCEPRDLPNDQIVQVCGTEWSKKILNGARVFRREVYVLTEEQGETELKL
ncbi:hypothetical protein F4780DRAFT_768375 [Xylariomycetidae sp. FL0641]|nr:hypothetical protein F4780DRAFT_768375 [Xylariomycetidae sp. FL0641]